MPDIINLLAERTKRAGPDGWIECDKHLRDILKRDFRLGLHLGYERGHQAMTPEQQENPNIRAGWLWGYNLSRGNGTMEHDTDITPEFLDTLAAAHAIAGVHDFYMLSSVYGSPRLNEKIPF